MNDLLNPYIAGAPVLESSMFFGREEVFRWIENSLAGKYVNHILVLHGQRRVGKTTVLKQIPNFLPEEYIQIFFDLQGRTNTTLDRFLWWMASEIVRTLNKQKIADLSRPERSSFKDPNTFITEFIPAIQNTLDGSTLLLTFDEFDTLARPDIQERLTQPLIAFLRRLFGIDALNFIFSIGSSGNKLENMQASYTDFFKTALYRKVSFLTEKDCYDLITKPVEGVITYQPDAVKRIMEITSGHPYFTQLTCHELFSLCQKNETWEINVDDVDRILDEVIERGTVNLKFVWDEASDLEKWALAALAGMEGASLKKISKELKNQNVRFSEPNLNSALLHLRDKDVLTRDNHFVIFLMKKWLQTNRPMDRVREELVQINPIANRYIEIGDEYCAREQYAEALESYQQALAAQSNNIFALTNIANIHLEQGNYPQAAAAFEKALAIDGEHIAARQGYSQAKLAQGDQARQNGETANAVDAYQAILNINPLHADAREKLAEIYRRHAEALLSTGSDEQALKSLQKALEMTPEDEDLQIQYQHILDAKKAALVKSWLDKAERALRHKRWDEAADMAQEALNVDPEDEAVAARLAEIKDAPRQEKIKTHRSEAQTALDRGNYTQAINAIQAAIQLAPEDEGLKSWLAQIKADQHEKHLDALRQRAADARQTEHWEEAIQAVNAWLELEPEDEEAQSLLKAIRESHRQARLDNLLRGAETAVKTENWETALQVWETYLEEVPKDQEKFADRMAEARKYSAISADYEDAQSLIKKKQFNKAIGLLQGIIAQDPTYKSTSRLLVQAVEANKAQRTFRWKPWFTYAIAAVVLLLLGIVFFPQIKSGVAFLGDQISKGISAIGGKSTPTISQPTLSPEEVFTHTLLDYSENTTPTLEDDFSEGSFTWGYFEGGHPVMNYIFDGELHPPPFGGNFPNNDLLTATEFILSFDFELSERNTGNDSAVDSFQLSINQTTADGEGLILYFNPQEQIWQLLKEIPESDNFTKLDQGKFLLSEDNTVQLLRYGNQLAFLLNGELEIFTRQIDNAGGENYFKYQSSAEDSSLSLDNVYFWNLDDAEITFDESQVRETPTAEELFASDVLAFVDSQDPSFEEDFSEKNEVWGAADSHDNLGEILLKDYIESSRLRLPSALGDLSFDVPAMRETNDYILSFEFSPQEAFNGIFFFFRKSDEPEQSYVFSISDETGHYHISSDNPDGSNTQYTNGSVGELSSNQLYEVMIVAKDSTIGIFWEEDLLYYDENVTMDGELHNFTLWSSDEEGYTVYLDNIRYWSLVGVNVHAAVSDQETLPGVDSTPPPSEDQRTALLNYINTTPPTFEDDFSTAKPEWVLIDEVTGEERSIEKYLTEQGLIFDQVEGYIKNSLFSTNEFVLDVDLELFRTGRGSIYFNLLSNEENNKFIEVAIWCDSNQWRIVNRDTTNGTFEILNSGNYECGTQINLRIISYQNSLTVSLNNTVINQIDDVEIEGSDNYLSKTYAIKISQLKFWGLEGVDISAWADSEKVVSTPQETAFTEAITEYINLTSPSLEYDFYNPDHNWGNFQTSEKEDKPLLDLVDEGALNIPSGELGFNIPQETSDFVLSFNYIPKAFWNSFLIDFRKSEDSSYYLELNESQSYFNVGIEQNEQATHFIEGELSSDESKPYHNIKIIAKGETIAIYRDSTLLYLSSQAELTGKVQSFHFNSNENVGPILQMTCIRFWDLEGIDIANAVQDIREGTYETARNYFETIPPNWQDDFSGPSEVWNLHSGSGENNLEDYLENEQFTFRDSMQALSLGAKTSSNDFMLQFEISPQDAFYIFYILFRNEGDDGGTNTFLLYQNNDTIQYSIAVDHQNNDEIAGYALANGNLEELNKNEMYEVLIVAEENEIWLFWEGELLAYQDTTSLTGAAMSFNIIGEAESGSILVLDNVRYWNLEGLNLNL